MGPEQILTLLLEEYKTLRAQVLNDLDRQYSVTNWGVSTIAVSAVGLATAWDKLRPYPTVLLTILMVVLPAIVTSYVIAWSHVLRSTLRAGSQLHLIEQRVTRLFTDEELRGAFHLAPSDDVTEYRRVLSWEHSLRAHDQHTLVNPATRLTAIALALVYAAVLATAVFACSAVYRESLVVALLRPKVIVAFVVWAIAWFLVTLYLHRAASLAVPTTEQPLPSSKSLSTYLPNFLTILRLLLIIPAVATSNAWRAATLVILAAVTDYLDGAIARRLRSVTSAGAQLDIIADKVFVLSLVSVLAHRGVFAWPLAVIAIVRDLFVEIIRHSVPQGTSIPTNKWGRSKFVTQVVSIVLAFLASLFQILLWPANVLLAMSLLVSFPGVIIVARHGIHLRKSSGAPTA